MKLVIEWNLGSELLFLQGAKIVILKVVRISPRNSITKISRERLQPARLIGVVSNCVTGWICLTDNAAGQIIINAHLIGVTPRVIGPELLPLNFWPPYCIEIIDRKSYLPNGFILPRLPLHVRNVRELV